MIAAEALRLARSDDAVGHLHRWGVAVIDEYLSAEEVARLRDECDDLMSRQEPWIQTLPYSIGQMVRFARPLVPASEFPTIRGIYGSAEQQEIAARYLTEPHVFNHDIFVVRDIVGSHHDQQRLHYDRFPHLKFFIYVTDVTIRQGPFHVVPGSQQYVREVQRDKRARGEAAHDAECRDLPSNYETEAIPIEGKAGTLIIFDTDVLHRASTLVEGSRIGIRSRTIPTRWMSDW